MGLLGRIIGRHEPAAGADPHEVAVQTTAALVVELRLHAEKLRKVADDMAAAHGIERRGDQAGQTGRA